MTPLQKQIREELEKEIDFMCDHWVDGDDKAPYQFGGWREEVISKLVDIFSSKLKSHDEELLKRIKESAEPYDGAKWYNELSVEKIETIINSQKYE